MGVLIVEHKLGFIHANAGIDRSNIDQEKDIVLLLPEDPDLSAKKLSESLSKHLKKNISVIITDTMGRPFRNGIVGFTIGSHNIECLIDERGNKDLYGNTLKFTQIAIYRLPELGSLVTNFRLHKTNRMRLLQQKDSI